MVLRATLIALAMSACLRPAPVVRAPESTRAAVSFVIDAEHGNEVGEPPALLEERVLEQLTARNLVPERAALDPAFAQVRDSERRLAKLVRGTDAPLAVLVEAKAIYSSPMNGRWRWTVHARLTALRREHAALTRSMDLSTFVDFEHEREPAALSAAAPAIAERTGAMLDELLSE
jgi:hypothetical protein